MASARKTHFRMRPNYRRILESILFLINEAERRGEYVTEYEIDKAIFIADVDHLNKHGRPITFDNYVAMKDGPVPSTTRDILQPKFNARHYYDESWPPWERLPSPIDGKRAFKFIRAKRSANLRVLSKTDIAALSEALTLVKGLRFRRMRDHTHRHPAYLDAWPEGAQGGSYPMDYAKLLDVPDEDAVEDLVYSSKHI
jgi:hypothetical protein